MPHEKPRRLLIVDDNRDAAWSLAMILRMSGFQVETAYDGASALEKAEAFTPDACILDINMAPMNGYELARRLREMPEGNRLVLAAVTACSGDEHLDRADRAGFDLHFTKPADPADVAEELAKASRTMAPGP